jgi:N,N-dimethylformamidase beta subunit-like, C-terminal
VPTLARIAFLAVLAAGAQAITVDAAVPRANPNAVRVENRKTGTAGWLPAASTGRAIEGYASAVSARPGERVSLHVSTSPAARYRIVVYRLGWYQGLGARRITCLPGCGTDELGTPERVPSPDKATGKVDAAWPVTDTLAFPQDVVSGYFLVEFVLTGGAQAGKAAFTYLVVRAPSTRPTDAIVQVPVNTWQAYNDWGGKSLYDNLSTDGRRANRVSFERPYAWAPVPGGQPLEWEYPLVRWLERSGYDVSYQTDADTDADPSSLLRHRLVISAGHGEYWTKTIRDAFQSARDSGGNLAFMGANTGYWQVRYEDARQTVVAYKSRSDPEPDPALKTTMFRDLEPPRYECELLGIQSQGVKLDWPPSDYAVSADALSDPWMRGTGFRGGDIVRGIVSVESDTIPGNQTAADSCGHRLTVFFHHETGSDKSGNADAVRYTAPSGARVFASGSHTFAWALDDFSGNPDETHGLADARLLRFARNAFDDLTRPAPPTAIDVRATGSGVFVSVDRLPDARVARLVVVRRLIRGRPSGPRVVTVCSVARRTHAFCRDRARRGTYRYSAFAADRWRSSFPISSAPVRVR